MLKVVARRRRLDRYIAYFDHNMFHKPVEQRTVNACRHELDYQAIPLE